MTYKEALTWLYGTQLFGIKLGLENISRLLRELDLPAPNERIIHVAGTNGKGSTCAMIDSICRAGGLHTGLFTSPHLVTYRERIRIDGEMIGESEVAAGLSRIRDQVRDYDTHPTFFEISTALALLHFRAKACEIVILETGMGGRLDATNAVRPIVSVLTPIGYDHQLWLGDTLEKIAAEKAGIVKANTPVVSAAQEVVAARVIRERATDCEAKLTEVSHPYTESPVALLGPHQRENAALAIAALRAGDVRLGDADVVEGLASVQWPARFQRWDNRTIIDGAHNPAAASALAKTWQHEFAGRKATIILGMLADKDVAGIWSALDPLAASVLLPPIRSERAISKVKLASTLQRLSPSIQCECVSSISRALEVARAGVPPILITGSLHFAGEALAVLSGNSDSFENCVQ